MNEIHEECGLFGIALKKKKKFAYDAYYALYALQHRGQEGAGIAISSDGVISLHKDAGLVNEVFTPTVISSMPEGERAIGHVRYSTTGADRRLNAQPLMINHLKGRMAIAHNGNLTNDAELREELERKGSIFHTTSDTEVIAYTITKHRLSSSSLEEAVSKTMDEIKGAFSLLVMSPTKLIAARDPWGFRPLCMGEYEGGYVFSSESCAFDAVGASFIRDVEPGEIITIDHHGIRSRKYTEDCSHHMCAMEYIYFARPDSDIEGCNVHSFRKEAGRLLYQEAPADADIVVGVPDSSLSAAMGYSEASGLPYEMGLVKNRYIGRTFIQPSQALREKGVRMKLSAVVSIVKDKRIVLIDDSVVRGTTSKRIVQILREAGAREVHLRIASPQIISPCFYGLDMSTYEELMCAHKTLDEVQKTIGADSIAFLSREALFKAGKRPELCLACFTGKYPTKLYQPVDQANKDGKF